MISNVTLTPLPLHFEKYPHSKIHPYSSFDASPIPHFSQLLKAIIATSPLSLDRKTFVL
jgi:hypothetical protein